MKKLIIIFILGTSSLAFAQITTRSSRPGFTLLTPNGIISQKESQINDTTNVAIGSYNLSANSTGRHNVAIGLGAMKLSNGTANIAIGSYSLQNAGAFSGHNNIAIGYNSLNWLTSGRYNVSVGEASLLHSNGNSNAALGAFALNGIMLGDRNTAVGYKAGQLDAVNSTISYSGNVFLGYMAGFNAYENNKLYIANSGTNTPLIWGDFNAGLIGLNGKVGIGTQNPQTSLHVYQNAGTSGLLLNNSFTGSGFLDGLFLGAGQTSSFLINRENNILFLGTNNINIATLHPNGYFGIGLNGLPSSSDLHIHKQDFADSELRLTNISSGSSSTDGFTIAMKNGGELEMNYKESQKVVFQTNTSATPELVLQTNGNLGLGVNNATTKLEVNGFTKLGTDAPAIKIKKLTVQTANTDAEPNNITYMPHGLNGAKILGVQVLVEYAPNQFVPHAFTNNPSYEFHFLVNNTNDIEIKVKPGNSSSILNKTARILITYEE